MSAPDDEIPAELGASAARWQRLSEATHRACAAGAADAVNEELEAASRDDDEFAPLYRFWMAEASRHAYEFDAAFTAFGDVAAAFCGHVAFGLDLGVLAGEQQATCLAQAGLEAKAARLLEGLIEEGADPGSAAWHHFRAARLSLVAGDDAAAREHYRAASTAEHTRELGEVPIPELARREMARLDGERDWLRPSVGVLASELAGALRAGDGAKLRALASATHFCVGLAGSELVFADRDAVLDMLVEDLAASTVRVDAAALTGGGGKRYLNARGWSGEVFDGRVAFVLSEALQGWEWLGLALLQPRRETLERVLTSHPEATNQPLPMPIHAPWPAGLSFRAGGWAEFAAEAASGASPWSLSQGPCGWGPVGHYYNDRTNPSHSGLSAFAIDFTRYQPGMPLANAADGVPALAVREGVVSYVVSDTPSGETLADDNKVWINHRAPHTPWSLGQLYGRDPSRYQSRYRHLAGPGQVTVFLGMWAPVGCRLGPMDDTGQSSGPHLHFSFHDLKEPGAPSVRPTPMFGPAGLQTLNDGEQYKCVHSVNAPRAGRPWRRLPRRAPF